MQWRDIHYCVCMAIMGSHYIHKQTNKKKKANTEVAFMMAEVSISLLLLNTVCVFCLCLIRI